MNLPKKSRAQTFFFVHELHTLPNAAPLPCPQAEQSPAWATPSQGTAWAALGRRQAFGWWAAALGSVQSASPVQALDREARTLSERLEAQLLRRPGMGSRSLKEAAYPPWLEGDWAVQLRLAAFTTPLGRRFVPPAALQAVEGAATAPPVAYRMRFVREQRPEPGLFRGAPRPVVMPDRAFNTKSSTDAVLGYDAVERVQYDAAKPDRQTVTFRTLSPDMAPLPPQQAELYFSYVDVDDSAELYVTTELTRQVLLLTGGGGPSAQAYGQGRGAGPALEELQGVQVQLEPFPTVVGKVVRR